MKSIKPEETSGLDLGDENKDEKKAEKKNDQEKDIGETTTPSPPLPAVTPSTSSAVTRSTSIRKASLVEEFVEEKEFLLGPYLGQYVVYTSPTQAWLLE